MLELKDVIKYVGKKAYAAAAKMPVSLIEEFEITQDPETNLLNIKSSVSAGIGDDYYDVVIVVSADGNYILSSECDCETFEETFEPCEHIALVLLQFLKRKDTFVFRNGTLLLKRQTDEAMLSLLRQVSAIPRPTSPSSRIYLKPNILAVDESNRAVAAEFQVQGTTGHAYVIKSLSDFSRQVRNHESMRYGKTLEFIHSVEIFDPSCRPLVQFLLSLADDKDMYSGEDKGAAYYSSYYSTSRRLARTLTFKGRYLDLFMKMIADIPFTVDIITGRQTVTSRFTLIDGTPEMEVKLMKEDEGLRIKGPRMTYGEGSEYLYFFDLEKKRVLRTPKNERLLPVLNYFSKAGNHSRYINNDDLPVFSKYLYPLIASSMSVNNKGFDPYEFLPPRPQFEFYLDLPSDDIITGEIFAVYGENRYNLMSASASITLRDPEEELYMREFFCSWFNSEDIENRRMLLRDDDDKTYSLLKDGISLMQDKGEVFISDKLKKLSVKAMSKVNIGISVVHDLLQLDLVTSALTSEQLAEVLSKYDRRKKFYKLKSGEFLTLGNTFDELENFAETLSLTPAQIALGTVDLPRYRAWSLEELEQSKELEFTESESYRKLVEQMKDTAEQDYVLPEGLAVELRTYQKEGFKWLSSLYRNGFSGLLSDEMGLGKTLQAIAFLGSLKDRKRCLIVCPASLVYNWSNEIERFLPSLPHRMITGTAPARKLLLEESKEGEILITSYDLLKRDLEEYSKYHYTCEIIDEAQYIKNSTTQASQAVKAVKSDFRIAMTGTPIENRLSELWSIFDYLMPGFFHNYHYFRDNFEAPIVKDDDHETEQRLTNMITPFVLRRLKKDVLKDLPDKLERVFYSPLEGEQKDLYSARVQTLKASIGRQTDKEFKENKIAILAELTRLRQLCCDPSLVYNSYGGNSAKREACTDLIRTAVESGHKVLLFSQFTTMLDELTKSLDIEGIPYHLLTGSTPKDKRNEMVESFADDDIPVFCISLKAGGTGLNLTAADIVIHYDPWWNTAVENQASDRAHRIGQKNTVTVYRLIMKDTIEERILKLQQEKSGLADRILSGEGISSSSLSREDLLELL